jgi:hypothetical protein
MLINRDSCPSAFLGAGKVQVKTEGEEESNSKGRIDDSKMWVCVKKVA